MIRALNEWRRKMGAPTLPTITGSRAASRSCRRRWRRVLHESSIVLWRASRRTMEHYRDLEACPDDLLGEPNAQGLGRFVRMAKAVRAGLEAPLRGAP